MRKVTKEEATRTTHLDDCTGWEDCECFHSLWSHAEVYRMQAEIEQLRSRICSMRNALQELSQPIPGDRATDYEMGGI